MVTITVLLLRLSTTILDAAADDDDGEKDMIDDDERMGSGNMCCRYKHYMTHQIYNARISSSKRTWVKL